MIGLWESEEAMRVGEELLAVQNAGNAELVGARGVNVGKYEIVLSPEEGFSREDYGYSEQPLTALG